MKFITLSSILFVIFIVRNVQSECCMSKLMIAYTPNAGFSCQDVYGGGLKTECEDYYGDKCESAGYQCTIKVCGDGKHHPGFYCGVRECNMFGCECDGGCRIGNETTAFRKFKNINTRKVKNARLFY